MGGDDKALPSQAPVGGPLKDGVAQCPYAKKVQPSDDYLHFEFSDEDGVAIADREVLLEHLDDGKVERVALKGGAFHRKKVAPGDYAVHFPWLGAATWSVTYVELTKGGPRPAVALRVEHFGLPPEATAKFLIFDGLEGDAKAALKAVKAPLTAPSSPLAVATTEVEWRLDGLRELHMDEGDAVEIVFRVEVGTDVAHSRDPLLVVVPAPPAPAPADTEDPPAEREELVEPIEESE